MSTVADVKTDLKRTFGDESGVQVTDTDILRWINAGQRQIVMQNENLLEKVSTASFTANEDEYSLPVDLLIFKFLTIKWPGEDSYRPIKAYDFVKFNMYIDGWDGTAYGPGTPQAYTLHAGKIIFFPAPDQAVADGIKIYYNRKPTDMVLDADTIDLPELYHDTLVKYCLTRAYKMDEDYEAAGAETAEMTSDLMLLRGRDEWKEEEVYPTITISLDDL